VGRPGDQLLEYPQELIGSATRVSTHIDHNALDGAFADDLPQVPIQGGLRAGAKVSQCRRSNEGCSLLSGTVACERRTAFGDPGARDRYDELYHRARGEALAANVLWGTAGALAVTSALLFVFEGRTPAPRRESSLAWLPMVGSVGGVAALVRY
jgi:hypothetical protein